MTTLEQRELAGVSPISEPALPTESKHDSDEAHKKANEIALDNKAMELYRREIELYAKDKQMQLAETFNPKTAVRREINRQLENGGLKYIPGQISPRKAA